MGPIPGQRYDATVGLYDYVARRYDPVLGRFIQPDAIVPNPGDPQSLNRYSYAANNPLRYTDPSGHSPQYPGDPDPNNAPCSTDWCWQNRWYMAHGYGWDGSGWNINIEAYFYDEEIAQEVIDEHQLRFGGGWAWDDVYLVLAGVIRVSKSLGGADQFLKYFGSLGMYYLSKPLPWGNPGRAWSWPILHTIDIIGNKNQPD